MQGLEGLHNNIMFYLAIILFAISWVVLSIVLTYRKVKLSIFIWKITPAIILALIVSPCLKLLYLIDELINLDLVIYGQGHQWYWSFQYHEEFSTPMTFSMRISDRVHSYLGNGRTGEVPSPVLHL
jgi:cytochrome c oxidase subunit 2